MNESQSGDRCGATPDTAGTYTGPSHVRSPHLGQGSFGFCIGFLKLLHNRFRELIEFTPTNPAETYTVDISYLEIGVRAREPTS